MNDLLHLKGRFEQAKAPNKPPSVSLPRNQSVKADKLHQLREQLTKQYNFWKNEKFIEGALISVFTISRLLRRATGYRVCYVKVSLPAFPW